MPDRKAPPARRSKSRTPDPEARQGIEARGEADTFFRDLVWSLRNGVLAVTRDGAVTVMNDVAYQILGLARRPSDIGKDPKVFPVISAALPWHWPVTAPGLIARAHAAGHKIRFWAVREEPWAVRELAKLGVDYVCLDRVELYRLSSSAARAQ